MYRKPEIIRSRNSAPLYPFVPDDEKEMTAKPNKISYARRTNTHSNDAKMECNKTVVTLAIDEVSSRKTLTPIHVSSASVNPISLESCTKEQQHTASNVQSPPVIMVVKECVLEEGTNSVRQRLTSPKGLKIPFNVSSTRNSLSVSSISPDSPDERPESRLSFIIRERLHSFAKDINRRTSIVKQRVIQKPPTPDEISLASAVTADTKENDQKSLQMKTDGEDNSSFASTDQKHACRNVADIRKILDSIRSWTIRELFKCEIFSKSIDSR
uniref:Uncharacterized protein n=1 Tax=Romanomermis culicivorax TaxID=13658 RepID=A0A915KIB5_ROMCU